ncbi:hypothetical protein L1987_06317 [Smallanthus sonchifolius]|uniref:Uncharacterized protein n=1 Tax=Smallanthus sonchifolius TaxID=185202 RepID=A0ACB9JXY3_9ASTR|nr:hypothetical protein L1987_06317 [Smallanthus sonchifolius]
MGSLTEFIMLNTHEEITSEGEISTDDDIPNVAYPSYLLHTCHHVQHLELKNDKRVEEVVFEMGSSSSRQLATIQPLLPYLKVLRLSNLKDMSHVWKGSWNKFLIPQHQPLEFPFQNLTDITLSDCHKIKYLFSSLMTKYLSNLKFVGIHNCHGIEEVISRRDYENEENTTYTSSHKNAALFPHLDTLLLECLPLLSRIDTRSRSGEISSNIINATHDKFQSAQVVSACWSLCQYPREIFINNCALSSLIPW